MNLIISQRLTRTASTSKLSTRSKKPLSTLNEAGAEAIAARTQIRQTLKLLGSLKKKEEPGQRVEGDTTRVEETIENNNTQKIPKQLDEDDFVNDDNCEDSVDLSEED